MTKKKITTVALGDESQNSGTENTIQPTKTELLDTINVANTIDFFPPLRDGWFKDYIKKNLTPEKFAHLKNFKIVILEGLFSKDDSHMDLKGIDVAWDLFMKNPDAPILLTSVISPKEISDNRYLYEDFAKVRLLLSKPNVKFLKLPFEADDLLDIFEKPKESQEDILKTITLKFGIDEGEVMKNIIKEDLKKIDISGLKDTVFIDLTHRENKDQRLQSLHGIDTALNELQKNPEKKIVMFTPIGGEGLKKLVGKANKSDEFSLVCSGKNVRLFEYLTDIKSLEHIFDAQKNKETNETNENILDTLHFYDIGQGWSPYLKEFFAKLDLAALHLKNSIVVDLRADDKPFFSRLDNARSDMSGLRIANETLKKDPNAKIILCSLIPIDVFKNVIQHSKSEEYLNVLLQGKNVRIIQSSGGNSMTEEEVLKQFDNMYQNIDDTETGNGSNTFKNVSVADSEMAFQKVLEGDISHFLHDARHWIGDKKEIDDMTYEDKLKYFFFDAIEKKSEKRIAFEDKLISLLQFQHPSYKKVSRERNLGGILDTYKFIRQKELPEGTRFEGVFVDRDGCFYDNEKKQFNQKVIDMIKEYEQQGKKVSLWTLGNLEIKQKQLDEAGLPYKIKSKIDYKGGTAEIVIDDENQEKFYANTRIKAEKFIKI